MDYLNYAREFFGKDKFATKAAGIEIDEAAPGMAVCSLAVEDKHLNAAGTVMGGVIFTLADFAMGIAANLDQPPTVTLSANITYLGVCKGKRLIARVACEKAGKSTCTYIVHVEDEQETKVALVTITGFRLQGEKSKK